MSRIQCMICGKELNAINYLHLRKHNVTVEEYIKKFPDAKLWSDKALEKLKQRQLNHLANAKKGWETNPMGGRTGISLSKESKILLSEKMAGHIVSEETVKKISETMDGHTTSEETCQKIGEKNTGKIPWNKGVQWSKLQGTKKRKNQMKKISSR